MAGGPYAINQNTLSAGSNYTISYTGANLTINPKRLRGNAANQTITYGDTVPITSIYYSGFYGSDNATSVGLPTSISSTQSGLVNAGTYFGHYSLLEGVVGNYSYDAITSNLIVNKAILTAAAVNQAITYGTLVPTTSISYSGFVNGENSSVIDTLAMIRSTQSGVVNMGSYIGNYMPYGAEDNNYGFIYTKGDLVVNSAAVPTTFEYNSQVVFDVLPPAFSATPKSTVKIVIADPIVETAAVVNKPYTVTIIISRELARLLNISQSNLVNLRI